MTPSVIKISHVLESHEHEVCKNNSTDHFHEYEVDCEFSKFKISPQLSTSFNDEPQLFHISYFKEIFSFVSLVSSKKLVQNTLRGPPALV